MGEKSGKLERFGHDHRDGRSGRYIASPACDGCGKPVGSNYFTDGEVCGRGDGPGFYLCERKRCVARREGLSIEARRALYEQTRATSSGTATASPTIDNPHPERI